MQPKNVRQLLKERKESKLRKLPHSLLSLDWKRSPGWLHGVLRRTVVSDWRLDNLCGSQFFRVIFTWLWIWLPHRLSKRQLLTTVLIRTPITQIIFSIKVCYSWVQTIFLFSLLSDNYFKESPFTNVQDLSLKILCSKTAFCPDCFANLPQTELLWAPHVARCSLSSLAIVDHEI